MSNYESKNDAENAKMPKKTYIEYYEDGLKYAKKAIEESSDITNNDGAVNPK